MAKQGGAVEVRSDGKENNNPLIVTSTSGTLFNIQDLSSFRNKILSNDKSQLCHFIGGNRIRLSFINLVNVIEFNF